MSIKNDFKIIVTGDYACFTMPQFKTERVSYDYPTPSALTGLIESIYYKPAIKIIVDKIVVFNPINHINIKRKEMLNTKNWEKFNKLPSSIDVSNPNNTTIRNTMLLTNVKYGVQFHLELTGHKSDKIDEGIYKHCKIMRRRLINGQYVARPYLGCREFGINSVELVDDFDLSTIDISLRYSFDIGFMLYGMKFADGGKPINGNWDDPIFSNKAKPMWYSPKIVNGVIDVAKYRRTIIC